MDFLNLAQDLRTRKIRPRPLKHDRVRSRARNWSCPLTVCVAALCSWSPGNLMLVGVSDKMLTASDLEFEPQQSKIYVFDKDMVALLSGDMTDQISICNATASRFAGTRPASVKDLANTYAEEFATYRSMIAEAKYLRPLGLTTDKFINDNKKLRQSLASDLADNLLNCSLNAETIIIGKDHLGYHIFVVLDPGVAKCCDSIGFAAIGYGQRHAESLLMTARYSRQWPWQRALLLTYAAKKRAEFAPGVGGSTDFFMVGAHGYSNVSEDVFAETQQAYEKFNKGEHALAEKTFTEYEKRMSNLVATYVKKQSLQASATTSSSDQT